MNKKMVCTDVSGSTTWQFKENGCGISHISPGVSTLGEMRKRHQATSLTRMGAYKALNTATQGLRLHLVCGRRVCGAFIGEVKAMRGQGGPRVRLRLVPTSWLYRNGQWRSGVKVCERRRRQAATSDEMPRTHGTLCFVRDFIQSSH